MKSRPLNLKGKVYNILFLPIPIYFSLVRRYVVDKIYEGHYETRAVLQPEMNSAIQYPVNRRAPTSTTYYHHHHCHHTPSFSETKMSTLRQMRRPPKPINTGKRTKKLKA